MTLLTGLAMGAGVFLVWQSWWAPAADAAPRRQSRWRTRIADQLVQAGATGVSVEGLVGVAVGVAVVVGVLVGAVTGSAVIAALIGAIAARGPFALVAMRAARRRAALREAWPEAVDNLASGVRAGLALPDALAQVGDRGPEGLRADFRRFAADYRASGRFEDALDLLKTRLADPIADRIIESLRVTREVGGADLGVVLGALSTFLREDLRTRGELESRQSWTVNAARLAVAAPWLVLLLLAGRPEAAAAYETPAGVTVLLVGAASTLAAYRLMVRIGRLPAEERVLR